MENQKTNLTVKLELITPDLAKNYLQFNKNNRSMSSSHVSFLSSQIKDDCFLENGEGIIFDKFGNLKDGQHRLKAISINKNSFYIPVIRGVQPKCMSTYDTGKHRSASDVLKLNGFQYSVSVASLTQSIYKFKTKKSKQGSGSGSSRRNILTNQEVLDYTQENYEWIVENISKIEAISRKMTPKVLSKTNLSLIVYLIGGENPSSEVYDFIKHLCGVLKNESSAPLYLYTKLYNAKINKEPLNYYWVLGMALKAWNYYADGNPAIKYFKFSVEQELPKPIR